MIWSHALAAQTHGHLILSRMFAITNGKEDDDVEHRRRQALVQTRENANWASFVQVQRDAIAGCDGWRTPKNDN
jgi:hypothetical protein